MCKPDNSNAKNLYLEIRVINEMENEHTTTKIEIVSLDERLINVCRRANGTNPIIVFDSYYTDSFLLFIDDKFPYIIRNGEYEWLVPLEDVTYSRVFAYT